MDVNNLGAIGEVEILLILLTGQSGIFVTMMRSTIAGEFLDNELRFIEEIQAFDQRRGSMLLRGLYKEDDPINFLALLAEVRTGLFLDPLCSELRYNAPIDGKRPDWSGTMNGQRVICEVLRLNTPEEEARLSIERSRERRNFQIENPGVLLGYHAGATTINTAYLCGAQSKVQYKEERYRKVIQRHQLPFIICVNPSVDTYINEIDMRDFLMGRHGFFTRDEHFGRNVAGVLLHGYFAGHWVYYSNDNAQFPLLNINKQAIADRAD